MDISKKVRILLAEHNMTATSLASRMEISQSYLSKKLKNNDWSVADIELIANIFDLKLEILFTKSSGEKI